MKHIYFITCLLALLLTRDARAQLLPPNRPEQDACGAIEICGNGFSTPYSYQEIGFEYDMSNTPCGGGEQNSMWLKLVITSPGIIQFEIVPQVVSDDYDFAIINATGVNCYELSSANVVRCNFNQNQQITNNGVVGIKTGYTQNFVASGTVGSNYVAAINATAGQTYLIMINNFGSMGNPSSGFTINFAGTTAVFNDQIAPKFQSLAGTCLASTSVTVQLSEEVKCNSIAFNGSDFILSPSGTVVSASGVNCNTNNQGYTDQVKVNFSPALAPGLYTIKAKTGTDLNTLLDLCDNALALPDSLTFRVYDLDSTVTRNICPAQLPFVWNGITVNTGGPAAAVFHKNNVVGCDSVATLNLIVTPTINTTVAKRICPYQLPYTWNGISVPAGGNNVATFATVSPAGCDSITTLNLTIQTATNQSLTLSGCGSVTTNNKTYINSQIAQDTVISSLGCDSLYRTLNITIYPVNPTTFTKDTADCGQLTYLGQIYTQNVTLRDTLLNQYGCDSIYNITNIIVYPNIPVPRTDYVANCDSVSFEGKKYFEDATLVDTFYNILGCDSLIRTTEIHVEHFELLVTADPPEPVIGDWVIFSTNANVEPYTVTAWLPQSVFAVQNTLSNGIKIAQSDTVKVVGISNLGCIDTAKMFIKADTLVPIVRLPNAFSPNGDGLNDVFEPQFVNKSGYLVKRFFVYNRWGQVVYSAAGTKKAAWRGTHKNGDEPAEIGTYFYYVDVEFVDGTKESQKGDIILIR